MLSPGGRHYASAISPPLTISQLFAFPSALVINAFFDAAGLHAMPYAIILLRFSLLILRHDA